ncbi:MAG: class I SAM-dependent DNA methyltransferase [Ruminococcaceae bacterium]|nr:class I SAM-dependent DNA methyltransferase [Oscillospiraceae bacterium]
MTDTQRRTKAKEFAQYWKDKGYEKGESQPFWLSLLRDVLEVEQPEKFISFEEQVKKIDHTSFIDGYIASTHVLIEQKGKGKDLKKAIKQSDGTLLTPFQQAQRYSADLPYSLRPRWIVTCNFEEFLVYDMEKPNSEPESILLKNLHKEYYRLQFLVDTGDENIKREMEVSIKAGRLVGLLYDEILKQYHDPTDPHTLQSLNMLCVRLVFCLYAEDAGVFDGHGKFYNYINMYSAKDMRKALLDLFRILDTKVEDRDEYEDEALLAFPYVNGGLFSDSDIVIPQMNDAIRDILLNKASADFDWSDISPTIFGAVFESTLNPETRRSGGMHYTSIENIHKVIDPLFLDDLKAELCEIKEIKLGKTREKKLCEFREKLGTLTFLDPACGSGNFLTETYLSLRRLENEAIKLQEGDQMLLDMGDTIKVTIDQFYGIEINDFAVTVAKTALWIAESQMMKETEDIIHKDLDFLPLKSNAYIVEGNALRIDWEDIVEKDKLNYIMGNPPFVGSSIGIRAEEQKEDKALVFSNNKAGKLDYVACWYKKASNYIENTHIRVAFVSTNSITQGEQVRPLWEDILTNNYINFAYRTFQWDSEATEKAAVHCVIIGFSRDNLKEKFISENNRKKVVSHINGYLVDAPDFYITSRGKAPNNLPKLTQGNKPWDDGGLILTPEERIYFVTKYPYLKKYIKVYMGSRDFINNIERYCFWFIGANPSDYRNIPEVRERLQKVINKRLASPTLVVQKQADTPTLFSQIRQPQSDYILIPETSGASRKYIPMGFMNKEVIASNSVMTAENADLHMFGILESNVHMSWVRTLCGRLKSDYRYSPALYNNFPWPEPTEQQRAEIEKTAQTILDARELYPDCSLADLYDELTMPPELRKAHQANDLAVMKAYGFKNDMSESAIVAELMKMYQELTK